MLYGYSLSILFFFLMIRRPPRSTLFPYNDALPISGPTRSASARALHWPRAARTWEWARSEEHTSELQSPCNLVCRLLLEKKKQPRRRMAPSRSVALLQARRYLHRRDCLASNINTRV